MKITKRQLRRIIKEAMPAGGVPDVVGAITGVPQGNIQNLVDEYKEWATEYMGTPSGANSVSVLATWIVENELSDRHDIHEDMVAELGFSHDELMREIKRQQKEYDAGGPMPDQEIYNRSFKESKMKITKNQLKRIIKEERAKLLNEYGSMSKSSMSPLVTFAQAYSGLGDAVQSQLIDLVDAHIEGRIEDAVYEMNPNALELAFQRLQQPLSALAREGSDDAMDMMDAMEAAAEIFAEGDAEVEADARAAGDR